MRASSTAFSKLSTTRVNFVGSLIIFFGLFSAFIWINFFATTEQVDPALLINHSNGHMTFAIRFAILNSSDQPAANAVVTLADQQRLTDEKGVVYFDHLMLHSNDRISVYYNGENYNQAFHLHSLNTVKLGWSNQFRANFSTGITLALIAFLLWLTYRYLKQNQYRLPGFKAKWQKVGGLVAFNFMLVQSLAFNSFWFAPLTTAQAAIVSTLPVPGNIKIEQDDNNAIVTWNGGPLLPDQSEPAGVTGYKISWGVAGQPLGNVMLTEYRIAQLQPLINGQPYQLQIQAVDSKGNLSNSSPLINFTGNPARVNNLRSQMTAFFDDFNLPAGSVDELKWNSAYSDCNEPSLSYFFINTQYHSHNTIFDGNCDRGQSISRPREIFDFTNRTGTIVFDFDGSFRRDIWYLDLVPQLTDITGHVHFDDPNVPAAPVNMLRLRQSEQNVGIVWIDATGKPTTIAETGANSLDWRGLGLHSNVRRWWTVKISQSKIEILVNNQSILAANLNLPFSKGYLMWNQFSYNTAKANQTYNMIHWDNFGFDGPKSNITTYNYLKATGGADRVEINNNYVTTLNIPDAVTGQQIKERLMFTMQPWGSYNWKSSDRVIVNGVSISIPQPQAGNINQDAIVGALTPYTTVLDLPKGTLRQGSNSLQFNMSNNIILNLHAEIDYPTNNRPAYTQPNLVSATGNGTPIMKDVGPSAKFMALGNNKLHIFAGTYQDDPTYNVSGIVDVKVDINNESALQATGKNVGISRIELLANKRVVHRENIDKAPAYKGVIKLDTSLLGNGVHEIHLQAYNTNGTVSLPDYFESNTVSGSYYPLKINVSNSNAPYLGSEIGGSLNLLPTSYRLATTQDNSSPKLVSNGAEPQAGNSSTTRLSVWGKGGIPNNATGITGVLTNVGCTGGANFRFWTGNFPPNASNLNVPGANPALNLSTGFSAPLDNEGKVYLGLGSGASTTCGYVVDITGYFSAPGTGSMVELLPRSHRLATTQDNSSPKLTSNGATPQVGNSSTLRLKAWGVGGIPSNAKGIVGVLTNVGCSSGANFRFWTGTTVPFASNLNVPGAFPQLNLSTNFIAPLDAEGKVYLGLGSGTTTTCGYVVDVVGYITSAPTTSNVMLLPGTTRIISTQNGANQPLKSQGINPTLANPSTVSLLVGDIGGVPPEAKGIIGVLTNVGCTGGANMRFWTGDTVPFASNLNIPGANSALNLSSGFIAPIDSGGIVNLGLGSGVPNSCGYIVDVVGYIR